MQPTCQRCIIAVILCGACCSVIAGPPASPPRPSVAVAQVHRPGYIPGIGQSLDPATLARLSGGTDVHNGISLNGSVSDTSTEHTVSGGNVISSGAFSNAVGLPMVIQNSGNSVLIQSATIVNVQMQP